MVVDRPPKARFYSIFDRWSRDVRSDYIERWKGVKVRPLSEELVKTNIRDWIDQKRVPTEPLYRELRSQKVEVCLAQGDFRVCQEKGDL